MKNQILYIATIAAILFQSCKKQKEPQPGNSNIIYKEVKATIDYDTPALLDLDGDNKTDFHFFVVEGEEEFGQRLYFTVYSEIGAGHKMIVRTEPAEDEWGFWAKAFDKGTEISATAPAEYKWNNNLTTAFLLMKDITGDDADRFGPWLDKQNGYLAIQFKKADKTHYGWVRLTHITGTDKIKLEDYAYNKIAGQAIKAGQQ